MAGKSSFCHNQSGLIKYPTLSVTDIFMFVRQDDCTALVNCFDKAKNNNAAVDVDLMDENGNTPLLVAARLGHPKSFRLLLQHGADALHVNRLGEFWSQYLHRH